jgi:ribosomal protein S12 methylthiotransferase accessory factor
MQLHGRGGVRVVSAGTGLTPEESLFVAVAEGIERYCAATFRPSQWIVATSAELLDEGLDLSKLPKCSKRELSRPDCPLVAADPAKPRRWVRALRLNDGKPTYIPAVLVYLNAGFEYENENIASPISTGCAAYTTLAGALLRGLLEVIERDAISTLWLQQLSCPRIEVDVVEEAVAAVMDDALVGGQAYECRLFDARTDVGVPTVYCIERRLSDSQMTVVACAAALEPSNAVAKVLRDLPMSRAAVSSGRPPVSKPSDCRDVSDGAHYMANVDRAGAFDFLWSSPRAVKLSAIEKQRYENDKDALSQLVERLSLLDIDVYAVDLTTDEAMALGFYVAKVMVPGLQPLAFDYRARYLGHDRLYSVPRSLGMTVHTEDELNPWPQPFG